MYDETNSITIKNIEISVKLKGNPSSTPSNLETQLLFISLLFFYRIAHVPYFYFHPQQSTAVIFQMWSPDQQHQYHLETCWRYKLIWPHPRPAELKPLEKLGLSNLCSNKPSGWPWNTLKFENHCTTEMPISKITNEFHHARVYELFSVLIFLDLDLDLFVQHLILRDLLLGGSSSLSSGTPVSGPKAGISILLKY